MHLSRNVEMDVNVHQPEIEKIMEEGILPAVYAYSTATVRGFSIFSAGWIGGGDDFYVNGSQSVTN